MLLFYAMVNRGDWAQLTGPTVNGTAVGVVQAGTTPAGLANRSIRAWYVLNPTVGTYDIQWNYSTTSENGGGAMAVCLGAGVSGTAPTVAAYSSTGSGASPLSTAIAVPAGGIAFAAAYADTAQPVPNGTQTEIGTTENGHCFSYKADATAMAVTFTGAPQIAQLVIAVKPAAAADTTAPTLTSPTGTSSGTTTANGAVTTNEGNGTLYYLASTNATETASTVKASGLTLAISSTGSKSVSLTGLTSATTYYLHFVHRDAAGNDSSRVSSASFTTGAPGDTTPPTLTSPAATTTGSSTAGGTVSTNEANGALYRYASTNATETAATVKAASLFQAVSATGVQAVSFTGLAPSTLYYAHYVHRDAAGNDSTVANSASFTTDAGSAGATVAFGPFCSPESATPLVTDSASKLFINDAATNSLVRTVIGATLVSGVATITHSDIVSGTEYRCVYETTDQPEGGMGKAVAT
ncbi:MAG: hypothetical protein ABIT83_17505 [Massilia sp.]